MVCAFNRTLNCTYSLLWKRNGTTIPTMTEVAIDLSAATMMVDEVDMAEMVADIVAEVEKEVSPLEGKKRNILTREEACKRTPATLRTI